MHDWALNEVGGVNTIMMGNKSTALITGYNHFDGYRCNLFNLVHEMINQCSLFFCHRTRGKIYLGLYMKFPFETHNYINLKKKP